MNQQEALDKMIAPGTRRPGKYRQGVIQIWLTRACNQSCYGCTQASNLAGPPGFITLENFEIAVLSLKDYFGVVGIFGGNPAMHPQFPEICTILRKHIPQHQCGLWCNDPLSHGPVMRQTFNPSVSNLNVHLDRSAYSRFRRDWPESRPFGLDKDSRHSPPYISMRDLGIPESERWSLISNCDINQHWSALIGQFRNEPRAWFCEIAGAQSMLHQHIPSYPDTGIYPTLGWWREPMSTFLSQVLHHCHDCGVPLRGRGELAQTVSPTVGEQTSAHYSQVFKPKRKDRPVQYVTTIADLRSTVARTTNYLGNV